MILDITSSLFLLPSLILGDTPPESTKKEKPKKDILIKKDEFVPMAIVPGLNDSPRVERNFETKLTRDNNGEIIETELIELEKNGKPISRETKNANGILIRQMKYSTEGYPIESLEYSSNGTLTKKCNCEINGKDLKYKIYTGDNKLITILHASLTDGDKPKIIKTQHFDPTSGKLLTEFDNNQITHYLDGKKVFSKEFSDTNKLTLFDKNGNIAFIKLKDSITFYDEKGNLTNDIDSIAKRIPKEHFSREVLISLSPDFNPDLNENSKSKLFSLQLKVGIEDKTKNLENRFGVKITYDKTSSDTKGIVSTEKLTRQLDALELEMSKYPSDFFKKVGLKEVKLAHKISCGNPSQNKKVILGEYTHGEKAIKLVDVGFAFDHELYHYLDYSMRPRSNKDNLLGNVRYRDNENFISTHATYTGEKGYTWYDETDNEKLINRPVGFTRSYGKTKVNEDQATVAESLFKADGEQSSRHIHEMGKYDSILGRKIALIKADYLSWDSRLDAEFFEYIKNGNIPDQAYWENRDKKKSK